MISCRKASELISLSLDRPLGLNERLALGLHLCGCGMCRTYRRQLVLLQKFVCGLWQRRRTPAAPELPPAAAARIARALEREQGLPGP